MFKGTKSGVVVLNADGSQPERANIFESNHWRPATTTKFVSCCVLDFKLLFNVVPDEYVIADVTEFGFNFQIWLWYYGTEIHGALGS